MGQELAVTSDNASSARRIAHECQPGHSPTTDRELRAHRQLRDRGARRLRRVYRLAVLAPF
jgi:hypothetical protein